MIDRHFKHLGHRVPRRRLQESYTRIHGPPLGAFGPRRILRRDAAEYTRFQALTRLHTTMDNTVFVLYYDFFLTLTLCV